MHALLPLGIHLPGGVAMKVDDNAQSQMIWQRCTNMGCEAASAIDDPLLKRLIKGRLLRIGFSDGSQTMLIEVPLAGFADAVKKLK